MKHGVIHAGEIRIGPLMLLLGVAVHLIFPVGLLFPAYRLDQAFGISLGLPWWTRVPLGLAILAASIGLEAWAMSGFFRAGGSPSPFHPTRRLVIAGPYRYCRHPIYAAYMGYHIGLGVAFNLVSTCATATLFWVFLVVLARCYEERCLRRRFGEEFAAYRRATPFMIPRIRHRTLTRTNADRRGV